MKKIFFPSLCLFLLLCLCACSSPSHSDTLRSTGEQQNTTDTSSPSETVSVRTPDSEATPRPAPFLDGGFLPETPQFDGSGNIITDSASVPVSAPASDAAPTESPSPSPQVETPPAAPAKVYTTKSPTSERILMGGSAQFVAYAENSTGVTWFIASPDGGMCVTAAEAPRLFPALWVSGCNSTCLTIGNVPSNMNGWQVQARFDGYGGPVHTNMATIYCSTLDQAMAQGWYYQPTPGYYAPTPFYPGW